MLYLSYTLAIGIASAAIYSVLEPIAKDTGLTLGDLNAGTGYMVRALLCLCEPMPKPSSFYFLGGVACSGSLSPCSMENGPLTYYRYLQRWQVNSTTQSSQSTKAKNHVLGYYDMGSLYRYKRPMDRIEAAPRILWSSYRVSMRDITHGHRESVPHF